MTTQYTNSDLYELGKNAKEKRDRQYVQEKILGITHTIYEFAEDGMISYATFVKTEFVPQIISGVKDSYPEIRYTCGIINGNDVLVTFDWSIRD